MLITAILQHRLPDIVRLTHRIHSIEGYLHVCCVLRNTDGSLRTVCTDQHILIFIIEHQLHRKVSISPCASLFIDEICRASIRFHELRYPMPDICVDRFCGHIPFSYLLGHLILPDRYRSLFQCIRECDERAFCLWRCFSILTVFDRQWTEFDEWFW